MNLLRLDEFNKDENKQGEMGDGKFLEVLILEILEFTSNSIGSFICEEICCNQPGVACLNLVGEEEQGF